MGIKISWREHREADGRTTLYARFRIPEKKADGSVGARHVERSTRTGKKTEAKRVAQTMYDEAHAAAHAEDKDRLDPQSFAAAARTYMLSGGSKQYLFPLIERIGLKKLSQVNQTLVADIANQLYAGCTAATVDRQVYTPIIAVLTFAKVKHALQRPAGHDSLPDLDVPKDDWYPKVLRVANPWLRAFLLTERLTGRRPGELLNRTREHVDLDLGTLVVRDNKGDQNIQLQLPSPVLIALKALPDLSLAEPGQGAGKRLTHGMRYALFGTFRKETMRAWLIDACKEAGVKYHMHKEAGRHAFVTKNLEAGKSLKWVMEAGRWKTLKVPAEKYGHLERQEVDRQARQAGEEWFEKMLSQPLQIEGTSKPGAEFRGDVLGDDRKKRA